ncbi:hypothetical protein Arub01_34950 [Actinomadura rubrobrunea]|uniref:Uncharacterized protein n=1 Tax=Actinomadura rubrobrunea TaxID=115335 RepID=A0A9W6UV26_9ACTN|nr:SUKH-4 family immunity protein [Actinomadura rubrobrunea]GLW65251.1 hypothetical protein Arub01_34950 [Actinomadura rubrobrunea]
MTYDQLAGVFGEDGVWRQAEAELPDGLSHEETRRFLAEVGLPKSLKRGYLSLDESALTGEFETLSELYESVGEEEGWTWERPPNADRWYVLGGFFGGEVAVDGETGKVWFVPDWDEAPTPLHSGVDALAYYMYVLERGKNRYSFERASSIADDPADPRDRSDVYREVARELVAELREADPTPFVDDASEPWSNDFAGPWSTAFFDIAEGTWSA